MLNLQKTLRAVAALAAAPVLALGFAVPTAQADTAAPDRGAEMGSSLPAQRASAEPQPMAGDIVSGVDVAEFHPNYDFQAVHREHRPVLADQPAVDRPLGLGDRR